MIGTNAKTVSTDATLTGNGTSGSPLSVAAPGLTAVSTDTTLNGNGTSGSPLSVAAPGLTAVTTDTTLSGAGTSGSPLSVADPSAGGSKMERVDTGAWETVRRSNGVITAVADAGGGVCTVTAAAHGQADGTTVTIAGTTGYNGDYAIANVTTDTFDITETFTSSQTGTFWVAANVYKCPSALACGGAFGTMRVRRFKGFTGGETITIWAASGISRAPTILGGYLLDSATGNTMSLLGYISAGGLGALQISSGDITLKAGTSYDDATDEYDIVLAYVQP